QRICSFSVMRRTVDDPDQDASLVRASSSPFRQTPSRISEFNAKPRTGSVARFAMDVTSGAAGVDRSAPMRRVRSRTGVENPSQSLAREVRGFDTGDA